jgi:hypothetical protein
MGLSGGTADLPSITGEWVITMAGVAIANGGTIMVQLLLHWEESGYGTGSAHTLIHRLEADKYYNTIRQPIWKTLEMTDIQARHKISRRVASTAKWPLRFQGFDDRQLLFLLRTTEC